MLYSYSRFSQALLAAPARQCEYFCLAVVRRFFSAPEQSKTSDSELVTANMLYKMDMDYKSERPVEGETVKGIKCPDFSFVDPSGDLILWEHLGMLNREDYRRSWQSKLEW